MSDKVVNASSGVQDNNDEFQQKMDNFMGLLQQRSNGTVEFEKIEQALESFVPPHDKDIEAGTRRKRRKVIEMDTTDYDQVENVVNDASKSRSVSNKSNPQDRSKISIASLKEQEQQLNAVRAKFKLEGTTLMSMLRSNRSLWKELEDIPLGPQGAKMMVTFGDGKEPDPKAVAMALLGTRRCLQYAIKDARALRRKQRIDYFKARKETSFHLKRSERDKIEADIKHRQDRGLSVHGCSAEMIFRVCSGYDPLSLDSKVGFDASQLEILFPEEMNAYRRWQNMKSDYDKSKDSKKKVEGEGPAKDGKDEDDAEKVDVKGDGSEIYGGHLLERLANFDARTDRMQSDWYMAFEEVRQGSLLPSGNNRKKTNSEREWDTQRRVSGRGRPRQVKETWEGLSSLSVQFLHWLGFDSTSALPPPSEEVAQALSFLGYDFFGKIVETAIFLRALREGRILNRKATEGDRHVLEMEEGKQLTAEDIELALNDTTLSIKPIYNATYSVRDAEQRQSLQLYFGPGFEQRLEMEMETVVLGKDEDMTEEEKKIREEEDELFSRIADEAPKKLDNITDVLGLDEAPELEPKISTDLDEDEDDEDEDI